MFEGSLTSYMIIMLLWIFMENDHVKYTIVRLHGQSSRQYDTTMNYDSLLIQ